MAAIVHRKASRGIRASQKQKRLAAEKGASDLDSGPVPEVAFTAYEEDSRVRKTMGKAADALQAAEVSEPSAPMSRTKRLKLIWNAGYTLFEVKLRVKIKLLYSFLQMLSLFGLCFQVSWPTEYEVVVRQVNQAVNLMPIGPIAVSCGIGFRWTWHHTLLLKTAAASGASPSPPPPPSSARGTRGGSARTPRPRASARSPPAARAHREAPRARGRPRRRATA